jgi:hypothetical protein
VDEELERRAMVLAIQTNQLEVLEDLGAHRSGY